MRLFLLNFLLFLALPLAAAEQAVVKHVVDGDTIVVQSGAATFCFFFILNSFTLLFMNLRYSSNSVKPCLLI